MSQQFRRFRQNISEKLNEYESDDENSNHSEQFHNFYSLQSQTTSIVEENMNLEYTFSMLEKQLHDLKKKEDERDKEIKKWKEKLKSKVEKENELKRHIDHIQKGKSKKLTAGFRNLSEELEEMKNQEREIRGNRLNAQEEKNNLYEKYIQMESKYKEVISYLQELNGVEESLDEVERQNKNLAKRIENIEGQIHEAHENEKSINKKNTREKIKELNVRVKELEKQQLALEKQVYDIESHNEEARSEERVYEEKNDYIEGLQKKIEALKSIATQKKAEHATLQTNYKQLCFEENKLKREQILEKECLEEQRRYKELTNKKESTHQFQIVESEEDEYNSRRFRGSPSPKKKQDPELERIFEQYDKLNDRMKYKK